MKLNVYIENTGKEVFVGNIIGSGTSDAFFEYSQEYISNAYPGISLSLPTSRQKYTPLETKNFFEGLLPEGFTRKTVAQWIHADDNDYLTILRALGKECLGAIKITDSNDDSEELFFYEKLSLDQVRALAKEGTSRSAEYVTKSHLSLAGASGKVGLYYDRKSSEWYLPIGNAPSTHIVKQSHIRLESIVCNEQLALKTAEKLGINVPISFVLNTGNNGDHEVLLATERYDRFFDMEKKTKDGLLIPNRLHQEDFAQCLGIPASNKYEISGKHYMKSMFDILRTYSSNPIEDQLRLWDIIVFNYLIGNTDGHIKNFSLIYSNDMKDIRLAPAYDLLSTIVYENSTRNMSFSIDGEYSIDKITTDNFVNAAKEVGISKKIALSRFDKLKDSFCVALNNSADELIDDGFIAADKIRKKILEFNKDRAFMLKYI